MNNPDGRVNPVRPTRDHCTPSPTHAEDGHASTAPIGDTRSAATSWRGSRSVTWLTATLRADPPDSSEATAPGTSPVLRRSWARANEQSALRQGSSKPALLGEEIFGDLAFGARHCVHATMLIPGWWAAFRDGLVLTKVRPGLLAGRSIRDHRVPPGRAGRRPEAALHGSGACSRPPASDCMTGRGAGRSGSRRCPAK